MDKIKQGIELGAIKVSALIFRMGRKLLMVGDSQESENSFATKVTGLNMDSTDDKFWAVWVADCFDPPIAVVRADLEANAEEVFVEQCPWEIGDEKNIKLVEVKLVRIETLGET